MKGPIFVPESCIEFRHSPGWKIAMLGEFSQLLSDRFGLRPLSPQSIGVPQIGEGKRMMCSFQFEHGLKLACRLWKLRLKHIGKTSVLVRIRVVGVHGKGCAQLFERLVVLTRPAVHSSKSGLDIHGNGIQFLGSLQLREGFIKAPHGGQMLPVRLVSRRVAGIEL